jgi:hypothetical protein
MYSGITTFLGSGLVQLTPHHLLSRLPYQTREKALEHLEPRKKVTPFLRLTFRRRNFLLNFSTPCI